MSARASSLTPTFRHRLTDTIIAQATRAAPGARAILRMSGPEAWPCVRQLLQCEALEPGALKRGCWPICWRYCDTHVLIKGHLLTWPAKQSYTGQDLVELHVPGSPVIVEALLEELIKPPVRLAEPGEFTLRAFLAGKLNLLQAEAIHELVEAQSQEQWQSAMDQLAGQFNSPLLAVQERLLHILAEIEAGLDFADEDLTFISASELHKQLVDAIAALHDLQRQTKLAEPQERAFRVVLAGHPNAGKSSLFNALLNRHAALVSPRPGTTRDYLEARLIVDDVPIDLIDTAGWAEGPATPLLELPDQLAQAARTRLWASADLILLCLARPEYNSDALQLFEQELRQVAESTPLLRLLTKADLPGDEPYGFIPVSARHGRGLNEVQAALLQMAREGRARASGASGLRRFREQIHAALQHTAQALAINQNEEPMELIALELRLALDAIGQIVGSVYSEDLLDLVFGRFCIGK